MSDHNDLIQPLRELAEGSRRQARGLPAATIRERGAARHRRRITFSVAGAALVIAGASIGVASVELRSNGSAPPAGPGPSAHTPMPGEPRTTIPLNFPLNIGFPALGDGVTRPDTYNGLRQAWLLDPCGSRSTDTHRTDFRTVGVVKLSRTSSAPSWTRQLAVYPDTDSATASYTQMRQALRACPEQSIRGEGPGSSPGRIGYQATEFSAGDESFAVAMRGSNLSNMETGEAAGYYTVVLVGNAVLMTEHHVNNAPSVPGEVVASERDASSQIADAMCLFAANGC